ncbi:MAG: HAD-IA family hydrolase [Ectothiorhodospiraceae bacterium]|nr:HAD-IA family hydrolase [Ectothiorhodospiraceae bacterium]
MADTAAIQHACGIGIPLLRGLRQRGSAPARPQQGLDAVLFDLDGTLLDTAPDLIHAANQLRVEQGLAPLDDSAYGPVVSHGSAAMIERGFNLLADDPRMQPLRQRFLDLYRATVSRRSRPFDGMPELLEQIEQRGLRWGIVTNKPGWLTRPLLEDLGLADRAACLVSGDTLPCRKPDPAPVRHACELLGLDPARVVLVGDAMRDVVSGQRAGTATLIALFGYICAEDRPADWGADGLISHPLDLLTWLDHHRSGSKPAAAEPRSGAA